MAENIDVGVDLSAPDVEEDAEEAVEEKTEKEKGGVEDKFKEEGTSVLAVGNELTLRLKANATKRKGRGFAVGGERGTDMDVQFESAPTSTESARAQRSVEGWIVFVTGIHEEATEETVTDRFADFGRIKNIRMEMDRRTGFYKGYAFIEYETYKEAQAAIQATNGTQLLGQTIQTDFAFVKGAGAGSGRGSGSHDGGRRTNRRRGGRSPSPNRADF